ncbi:hypothetical protein D3C78_867690 [compost metagenome]
MPAQTLRFKTRSFRFGADVVSGAGTVGFTEGMATGDQRHGFFIVHGHAAKCIADVLG